MELSGLGTRFFKPLLEIVEGQRIENFQNVRDAGVVHAKGITLLVSVRPWIIDPKVGVDPFPIEIGGNLA